MNEPTSPIKGEIFSTKLSHLGGVSKGDAGEV